MLLKKTIGTHLRKCKKTEKPKKQIITLLVLSSFQPQLNYARNLMPVPDALSIERPRMSDIKPDELPQKKPKFRLPPIKISPKKNPKLSTLFRVFIKKIELSGNTVFPKQELQQIIGKYENRLLTNHGLQFLKYQLSQYYIEHGYINSGVILPDQQINDGILHLQVIEGEVSEFQITGNDWLRASYIKERVAQSFGPPLNIKSVQERLLLIQQDPLIKRINAELRPGEKPGKSKLFLAVTEARPYHAGVVVANDRSPSIGGISGKIWLRHNNLTGFGDALSFSYTAMDGLNDFSGYYSLPLTAYDTKLNFYYQYSESDVVEQPLDELLINSRAQTYGISLEQPFYRTANQSFTLSLAFEYRFSKTFLDRQPFSFSEGVPETGDDTGESRVSVLRFSQEWLDRNQKQVIAARSTFNVGINVLNATHHTDGKPDSQFFVWLGQFQWIRRLAWLDSQVFFRTDIQLADDSLLPLEKFSIGGMHSVRGYRENQFVRDNGASSALEWRVPVFQFPIPGLSDSMADGIVQLATFLDFGWSENSATMFDESEIIGSWGLGLLWEPSAKINAEFYWGLPFYPVKEGTEHDIQDYGIHFQINAQY